jgi:hypothetical protein
VDVFVSNVEFAIWSRVFGRIDSKKTDLIWLNDVFKTDEVNQLGQGLFDV